MLVNFSDVIRKYIIEFYIVVKYNGVMFNCLFSNIIFGFCNNMIVNNYFYGWWIKWDVWY